MWGWLYGAVVPDPFSRAAAEGSMEAEHGATLVMGALTGAEWRAAPMPRWIFRVRPELAPVSTGHSGVTMEAQGYAWARTYF